MATAAEAIRQNMNQLVLSVTNEEKRNAAYYALQRLVEDLDRVTSRYEEYQHAKRNYSRAPYISYMQRQLPEFQQALTDICMAYHQQIYATISSLCGVLNKLKASSVHEYPSGSNQRLLKRLQAQDLKGNTGAQAALESILTSVIFRDTCVDHPA